MQQSVSPLFIFLIASIVVLAVGVHAVSAGDPAYGSDAGFWLSDTFVTDG